MQLLFYKLKAYGRSFLMDIRNHKIKSTDYDNQQTLKLCDLPVYKLDASSFLMVIFGGTGDLSQRKLIPALFNLFLEKKSIKKFSIIGLDQAEMSNKAYHEICQRAIQKYNPENYNHSKCEVFLEHFYYISGNLIEMEIYQKIKLKISQLAANQQKEVKSNVIYYLAIPPKVVIPVVEQLNRFDLCQGAFNSKVIIEKPFGNDRKTARKLNKLILKAFEEEQVYRIDHYLGKDTVQNIFFFRLSNTIFEPLWNRNYINQVQITVAEDIGIEGRGKFYEQTGVVRDMVQNHIMQLIAMIAIEPPVGFEPDYVRDEKVKVFHAIRMMDEKYIDNNMIRGQYGSGKIKNHPVIGYRQEEYVSPDSNTPTFFFGKFYIDNWRWANVPFYVRTGKRLPKALTEIYIQFKSPPLQLLGQGARKIESNAIRIGIQPNEEIALHLNVKQPGINNELGRVKMLFNYEKTFKKKQPPAYERLIMDCIKGDLTLFARQDGVEAMWSIVDPIIQWWESHPSKDFPNYPSGSWGPPEAALLLEREGQLCRYKDIL